MQRQWCEQVAFVDGARSAFAISGQHFAGMPIYQMAREVGEALVRRNMLSGYLAPKMIDRVIFGSTVPDQQSRVPARDIVLESSFLPKSIAGASSAMFCITGFYTAASGADAIMGSIARGNNDVRLVLCGGGDNLTRGPLYVPEDKMLPWKMYFQLLSMLPAKRPADYEEKLAAAKAMAAFETPDPPAIAERATGFTMLHHCEMMIPAWGITRGESDAWAAESQSRAAAAQSRGFFAGDIIPLAGLDRDPGIRETSVEKLAGLWAIEKDGIITAGTATGLNDGVSEILLARPDVAKSILGRKPTVFLIDSTFDGIDPENGLLMGPAKSFAKLMRRHGLTYDDLAVIEGHEAFAAQILCVDQALERGFEAEGVEAIGKLPRDKVNPNGGSLALGHPFSATGGRILINLARELQEVADATGKEALGAWFACAAGAMSAAGLMLVKPSK